MSVDMNWGFNPQPPTIPTLPVRMCVYVTTCRSRCV